METNFNINPWYDDFDKTKGFHRILFNPTFAVQARELTQMQTILQNQIEQFGSHIFKHGSLVIPGNSDVELNVPYVKIQPTHNSSSVNVSSFSERIVIGQSSGVRAYVKKVVGVTQSDPITFYLSYLSGGNNSELTFIDGEVLYVEGSPSIACSTQATNASGSGSIAFIKAGVFYVHGHFVYCHPQIEVISKYSTTPSVHVLLKITEETVSAAVDETLLDPAQGSYNFAAPGADRFKISLNLTTIPLGDAISDNFIEIMRFEEGVMTEHVRSPKYNELEKSLAIRTYDESGNYIVDGFDTKIREHKKTRFNDGMYDVGNSDKFVYNISAGKAYFQGFPIEKISGSVLTTDKARSANHVKQTKVTTKPKYGQFLFVSMASGSLDIFNRELVQLWDVSASTGGAQIGTAKAISIDYHTGDGVNPIYKLFISDAYFSSGSYEDIGSIRTASGNFFAQAVSEYEVPLNTGTYTVGEIVTHTTSLRTATTAFYDSFRGRLYAHRHSTLDTPKTGDLLSGTNTNVIIKSKRSVANNGQSGCIFSLPTTATKSLKNDTNVFDFQYTHHIQLNIPEGSTTTATVSGTIVPIEVGNFIALGSSGSDSISNYSINGTGTAIIRNSPAPVGGISVYAQVTVENGTPRTKSLTSYTASKSASNVVLLDHADVSELVSVIVAGVETINMWELDTGATDYEYGISKLKLKVGFTQPTGQMTISYKYFFHTPGDFFTVDSYAGITNDQIPSYQSTSTGMKYELRDVIDFRKTYSIPSNIVVGDTIISTSLQKYVGRIDSVCLTKDSRFKILSGTPSENPKSPRIPTDVYEISQFFVPAYTYSISDIIEKRVAVTRYTMSDIKNIDDRLSFLEEFSTLTSNEASILSVPVIDESTGLERFKTGYLIESMEDPFGIADITTQGFSASLNSLLGIYPKVEMDVIPMTLWNAESGGYRLTNGVLTMNYTEVPLAEVSVSSRLTSLNPFLAISWVGDLTLTPPGDVWVDVIDNPTVTNNETVTEWVNVPSSPSPASEPAPSPPIDTSPTPSATSDMWIYGTGGAKFNITTNTGINDDGQPFSRSEIQAAAAQHIAAGGTVQQMVAVAASGGYTQAQAEQILGISLPLFSAPLTTVPAALLPGAIQTPITNPINAIPVTVPPVIPTQTTPPAQTAVGWVAPAETNPTPAPAPSPGSGLLDAILAAQRIPVFNT